MDAITTLLIRAAICGVLGSLFGVFMALFGKHNEERLRVGNASGIGFLVGASIGALIGIFESMLGRL
jgi:hypothetical protein